MNPSAAVDTLRPVPKGEKRHVGKFDILDKITTSDVSGHESF
jgi:hypothetical protein